MCDEKIKDRKKCILKTMGIKQSLIKTKLNFSDQLRQLDFNDSTESLLKFQRLQIKFT